VRHPDQALHPGTLCIPKGEFAAADPKNFRV
jgi:hypothetical protein